MTNAFNRVLAHTSNGTIVASVRCSDADTERVHDELMALDGVQGCTTIAFPQGALREDSRVREGSSLYSGPEFS